MLAKDGELWYAPSGSRSLAKVLLVFIPKEIVQLLFQIHAKYSQLGCYFLLIEVHEACPAFVLFPTPQSRALMLADM